MIPRVSWQFNGEKNWVDIDEINLMDKRKLEYYTYLEMKHEKVK